ncbi:MAG: hypothetical protein AB1515_10670 [Nitrospirota bacterium]
MGDEVVAKPLSAAISELLDKDRYLLQHNLNERTISHRLASYMQSYFKGWDVDCEYNRDHDDPKKIPLPRTKVNSDDVDAKIVFPDIIVHHRGRDNNLLVIELKKSTNRESTDSDLEKLRLIKKTLKYKHALSIRLQVGESEVGIKDIRTA